MFTEQIAKEHSNSDHIWHNDLDLEDTKEQLYASHLAQYIQTF